MHRTVIELKNESSFKLKFSATQLNQGVVFFKPSIHYITCVQKSSVIQQKLNFGVSLNRE